MQTIPSYLNAEELLRWYDSTWNKLTNSEMEERLADALKEALDENDELKKAEQDNEELQSKISELEAIISRIADKAEEIKSECEL